MPDNHIEHDGINYRVVDNVLDHNHKFVIVDLDNGRQYDYVPIDEHNPDRPDVEFNDDGSVHINTPGDYHFLSFNDDDWIFGWKRTGERVYNFRGDANRNGLASG